MRVSVTPLTLKLSAYAARIRTDVDFAVTVAVAADAASVLCCSSGNHLQHI